MKVACVLITHLPIEPELERYPRLRAESAIIATGSSRGPQEFPSEQVWRLKDGAVVIVAGLVIRRHHPGGNAAFITLEDEFGHTPLVIWPRIFERYRLVMKEPVPNAKGFVPRREDSM